MTIPATTTTSGQRRGGPTSVASIRAVRPDGGPAAVAPGVAATWPRWTRLTIERPPPAKKDQVALWRELRRQGALKVEPGTWAVGHAPDGSMPLDRALELAATTGGEVTCAEPAEGDHDRALRQACRRIWAELHVEADQLEEEVAGGDLDAATAWAQAERLRLAYGDGCRGDLVGIDARRAGRRLAEVLAEVARSVGPPDGPGSAATPVLGDRRLGRLPASTTGTARRDGTARYVVQLRTLPPWAWEQDLAAFEARCYLPSPDRPPLVHGVVELLVAPDRLGACLGRLADRLEVFEATRRD